MRSDLTDITLIVDRSGSMGSVCEEAEGGVNAFIKRQQQQPGEALLTLVQFDTEYEFVTQGTSVQDVPLYKLIPRGMTALLDAVGQAIQQTGERLASMPEHERPGLVIVVVMTDGLENSSCEFTKSQVKSLIQHQQDVYDWQFTFLGANQDAFEEARSMGMPSSAAANYSPSKTRETYQAAAGKVARMRMEKRAGRMVKNEFTEEERRDMQSP